MQQPIKKSVLASAVLGSLIMAPPTVALTSAPILYSQLNPSGGRQR
jgi:hypothetical protein